MPAGLIRGLVIIFVGYMITKQYVIGGWIVILIGLWFLFMALKNR